MKTLKPNPKESGIQADYNYKTAKYEKSFEHWNGENKNSVIEPNELTNAMNFYWMKCKHHHHKTIKIKIISNCPFLEQIQ